MPRTNACPHRSRRRSPSCRRRSRAGRSRPSALTHPRASHLVHRHRLCRNGLPAEHVERTPATVRAEATQLQRRIEELAEYLGQLVDIGGADQPRTPPPGSHPPPPRPAPARPGRRPPGPPPPPRGREDPPKRRGG